MQSVVSSGDPVPAIREADATGEIADLFADLRATLGVPIVNLVWRHLAIRPGALAWAWQSVKPLYVSGAAGGEARALRTELTLPAVTPWPAASLAAVGLSPADVAGVRAVLDSYDRSNTLNLLALGALLHRLDGAVPVAGTPEIDPGGELDIVLPKLLTLAEMTPAAADLVPRLNMLGERDEGRILASMYRHLSHWPGFLALAHGLLAPLDVDGRLAGAIGGNLAAAKCRAAVLANGLAAASPLPDETRAFVRAAVGTFVEHPIGKMVTICRIVRTAMPEATMPEAGMPKAGMSR